MGDISLNRARRLIAKTLAKGQALGLKPLSVIVLDAGGNIKAFERQDGASNLRFQMAHGKAYGALGVGMGSRGLMNRAETQPYFTNSLTACFGGHVLPVPGGILVRDKRGAILGALGVTGDTSDNDEAAGVAGIEAVGLVADPG